MSQTKETLLRLGIIVWRTLAGRYAETSHQHFISLLSVPRLKLAIVQARYCGAQSRYGAAAPASQMPNANAV